jgi:hypothetical protein
MQVQQWQHLGDLGLLRHHGGRITERNRARWPVTGSTRWSSTRGARTATAPAAVRISGWRACPLRTTSLSYPRVVAMHQRLLCHSLAFPRTASGVRPLVQRPVWARSVLSERR